MKLYAITVLYKSSKVQTLKAAYDLSSFGYFQRSSVQEFMRFTSQIITERSSPCTRASIKEQGYLCHVYVRSDNLAGVIISDHEYPQRVCFTLLNKVLSDFAEQVAPSQWPGATEKEVNFLGLDALLAKYQDPTKADSMTKIETDLEETKVIMHDTIQAVLARGEKLDDLVAKSDELGLQSKAFYKTARKTNQCCSYV